MSNTAQHGSNYPDIYGTLANRPSASSQPDGRMYVATDQNGGTVYQVENGSWVAIAPGTSALPQLHGATHEPGGSDDLYSYMGALTGTRIEPYPRYAASTTQATVNGTIYLSYLTVPVALTASNLTMIPSALASGLTLVRAGIYTIDGSGNLTLVAATADLHSSGSNIVGGSSNVGAFLVAGSQYLLPLTLAGDLSTPQSSYALVRGTRYAFGFICYSSGSPTMPSFHSANGVSNAGSLLGIPSPRMSAARATRTDLDTTMTSAQAGNVSQNFWIAAQ